MPALWCLAAAALFGASTPASKALLEDIGPCTLAGLLHLGAAAGTAPFAFRGKAAGRPDRDNRLRLAGAVLFGGVFGPSLLMPGSNAAPSASVSLRLNLEAAATAILAWALFREDRDRRAAAAAVMAGGLAFLLTHVRPGLPAWIRHTHEHTHEPVTHSYPHHPDPRHR
ncbi:MAG: EamA family transporter, partial [Planctomycetota bacterium]